MTQDEQEFITYVENKIRTQVQQELLLIQSKIFGKGDLILLSAKGVDGSRKLAEILVEEAQKNLNEL